MGVRQVVVVVGGGRDSRGVLGKGRRACLLERGARGGRPDVPMLRFCPARRTPEKNSAEENARAREAKDAETLGEPGGLGEPVRLGEVRAFEEVCGPAATWRVRSGRDSDGPYQLGSRGRCLWLRMPGGANSESESEPRAGPSGPARGTAGAVKGRERGCLGACNAPPLDAVLKEGG